MSRLSCYPLCSVAQSTHGIAVNGSQPAPGLPCALFHRGEATKQSSGEIRREDAKACLAAALLRAITELMQQRAEIPIVRAHRILNNRHSL
jgi:hypothetical protein